MSRLTNHLFIAFICLFTAITPLMADTVVVNTVNDVADGDVTSIATLTTSPGTDGVISLREAILAANNTAGADVIEFNITGAGPHTIAVSSQLPFITETLTIDGYSQSGAVPATTTSAAVIQIELSGGNSVTEGLVINLNVSNCLITGLAIGNFQDGISILGSGNTIAGNYIGSDASGTVAASNFVGIDVANAGAFGNTIGGATPAERNIISGNDLPGIVFRDGPANNKITGNYIGTNPTGTVALGNSGMGIIFLNASHNQIGGLNPGEGNVISANGFAGQEFAGGGIVIAISDSNTVQGNLIGTDVSGTQALPNANIGIHLSDQPASKGNVIESNIVANTAASNDAPGIGIKLAYADSTSVIDNAIYGNDAEGILHNSGIGNTFTGNSIYANGALGIDLAPAGVTANDDRDTDNGPNNLQNFPEIIAASIINGNLQVLADFNSLPSTTGFRIEFFGNSSADPSGNGEGEIYLGFLDLYTDDEGNPANRIVFTSTAGLVKIGDFVTATATAPDGSTSEFSNAFQVVEGGNCFLVTNTNDDGDGSLRAAMDRANFQPNIDASTPDTIKFDIPGAGPHTISVLTKLPSIIEAVVIDGTTEPDADCTSWPPTLAVEVRGGSNSFFFSGFSFRSGTDGSTIRGLVINSFRGFGIRIYNSDDNTIECNFIGTDVSGTQALPNLDDGIEISNSFRNTVGGLAENQRNLLSGNGRWGIGLLGGGEHQVLGNYVGTDVSGASPLGNGAEGIILGESSNNIIGGVESGSGNIIAYNGQDGIYITTEGGIAINNALLGNSIFNNGGLGINLEAEDDPSPGVTLNDPGDGDSGPNNHQNFPLITEVAANGSTVSISGFFFSTSYRSDYRLEFFANSTCNGNQNGNPQEDTEYGEGEIFLGAIYVDTDGNGNAYFCASFNAPVEPGAFITATATAADNNTSEFAQCKIAEEFPVLNSITVTTADDVLDGETSSIENLIMFPGSDGLISLREAIAAANNNPGPDEIRFDSGLDGVPIVLDIGASEEDLNGDGDLDIRDCTGLTIIGNGADNTIIDGNASERVFDQLAGDLTISGVKVQNGKTTVDYFFDGTGGGLRNLNGGNLTISNSEFSGNETIFDGGALFVRSSEGSNVQLNASSFTNNFSATDGGAFHDQTKNGIVKIDSCIFTGNYATREGGGFKADASQSNTAYFIRNSIFSENTGISGGGGIEYDASGNGSMLISNSTISENYTADEGGGVNFSSSNCVLTITNTTISGNRADDSGGGINHGPSSVALNLNFVTITDNIADDDNNGSGEGGGIDLKTSAAFTSIKNSIVFGNIDRSTPATNDCGNSRGGTYNSQGGNVFGVGTGCPTGSGDIEAANALLGPLQDNGGFTPTHALLQGSPAINFASCGTVTNDQRDEPRNDGFCDAGAFELPGTPVEPNNPHEYTLLAAEDVEISTVAATGNIHANDDVKLYRGAPTSLIGNISAVDDIEIRSKNTINGDVSAGDDLDNDGTINGTASDNASVDLVALPVLNAYSAGGDDVTVEENQDIALPPASYADVEVESDGTLRFASGEYFLDALTFNSDARFVADVSAGEVIINIVSDLEFGQRMTVEVNGGSSDLLTFNKLQSRSIELGREATVLGNIIAPNANVRANSYVRFRGAICAKDITFSTGAVIFSHDTNQAFPKQVIDDEAIATLPETFSLDQNYPNPFNPTTTIRFALPEASDVLLEIYNVTGQKVRTLLNSNMTAGVHTLQWDATNERGAKVSSGIYIYRINAGTHQAMKKMILLK